MLLEDRIPEESKLWKPNKEILVPSWVEKSPSYILLALELLRDGKSLSELHWRDFEKLIGDLLESDGWTVFVTQKTRDGGIDIVATKSDPAIGPIKSIWQAKRYGPTNKVTLKEVRELSGVLAMERATKAVVVTTNCLTRDAINWVQRDLYRLDYKDKEDLENWLNRY